MKALFMALLSSVTLCGKHFQQSVEALKAEMNQFYDNGVMERKKGQKKGKSPDFHNSSNLKSKSL